MTAPLHKPPRPSAIPASQNTAPVAEFRCLFTADIRQKKKRWQDGFLKFHTFNNRVMVYDEHRYFQGDTYWKESNALQEGEELALDKGYLVQVGEPVGVTQTDLTPLFEKNRKSPGPEPGKAMPVPRSTVPVARAGSQLRHKSLNALLGTPKGPIGKSVSITSPYEQRLQKEKEKENEWTSDRAAKRQRTAHASANASSSPIKAPQPAAIRPPQPVARQPAANNRTFTPPRPAPQGASTITIESTPEEPSSDFISTDFGGLGSTPPRMLAATLKQVRTPAILREPVLQKQVPVQVTPAVPKRKIQLPRPKPIQTPQPPARFSSPPVSASNRLSNVNFALETAKGPATEHSPPQSPPRKPGAKALRLSTGVKRRMLVCQSISPPRSRASKERSVPPEPKPKKPRKPEMIANVPNITAPDPLAWLHDEDEDRLQLSDEPEPELPPVVTKKRKVEPQAKRTAVSKKPKTKDPPPPMDSRSSTPAFEDIDVIHGLLDQQMVPKPAPKRRLAAPQKSPPSPAPPAKKTRVVGTMKAAPKQSPPRQPSPPIDFPEKPTAVQPMPTKKLRAKQIPPPPEPESILIPDSPTSEHSLPMSPVILKPSISPPCAPTITAPIKKPLSTSGFRKKKPLTTTTNPINTDDPPAPIHRGSILPPLPAPAPAPALPAPVQPPAKPRTRKRRMIIEGPHGTTLDEITDEIEDDVVDPGYGGPKRTTNSSFRRLRSANDTPSDVDPPILSMSGEWERRNLGVHKQQRGDGDGDAGGAGRGEPPAGTAFPDPSPGTIALLTSAAPVENPPPPEGVVKTKRAVKGGGLAALINKTDPRRKFLRTASLNVDTNGGKDKRRGSVDSNASVVDLPSPVVDTDVGPWSTEAFDLFDWRPPGMEKR